MAEQKPIAEIVTQVLRMIREIDAEYCVHAIEADHLAGMVITQAIEEERAEVERLKKRLDATWGNHEIDRLQSQLEKAVEALRAAIETGKVYKEHADNDPEWVGTGIDAKFENSVKVLAEIKVSPEVNGAELNVVSVDDMEFGGYCVQCVHDPGDHGHPKCRGRKKK